MGYEVFSKNYNNSIFISEIVSAANNLFSYANACLLLKQSKSSFIKGKVYKNVLHLLSIVEFSQVLLRSILLFYYKDGIYISQNVKLITHNKLVERFQNQKNNIPYEDLYMGKHSGLVMKTLIHPRASNKRWLDTQDKWLHEVYDLPPSNL